MAPVLTAVLSSRCHVSQPPDDQTLEDVKDTLAPFRAIYKVRACRQHSLDVSTASVRLVANS